MHRTCKTIVWSLLLTLAVGWTQAVRAQDQNPSGPTNTPPSSPSGSQPAPQGEHRHKRAFMRVEKACKSDIAQLCPDAKGKALGQCLAQGEKDGKLSDQCTAARAKMKKWRERQGQQGNSPKTKAPATPPPD